MQGARAFTINRLLFLGMVIIQLACNRQAAPDDKPQFPVQPADSLSNTSSDSLLPATEPAGALIVAERIRAAVAALNLPHSGSSVAGHVTVSIGVASTNDTADGVPAGLVAAADAALYRAKHEGRNRVAQAPQEGVAPSLSPAPPAAR